MYRAGDSVRLTETSERCYRTLEPCFGIAPWLLHFEIRQNAPQGCRLQCLSSERNLSDSRLVIFEKRSQPSINPRFRAMVTVWVRSFAPSLERMLFRWYLMVASEICNCDGLPPTWQLRRGPRAARTIVFCRQPWHSMMNPSFGQQERRLAKRWASRKQCESSASSEYCSCRFASWLARSKTLVQSLRASFG